MLDFQKLSAEYQQALLRQVVPFWLKNSQDSLCGGYFDMLTDTGEAIEGDKYVAMQAQQAWAFSWLYNTYKKETTWLEHARHGVTFLSQFAHDESLNCYVQLDRRGRPVAYSSNLVSASFASMAYTQFHQATGEDEWAMLAKQTLSNALQRREKKLSSAANEPGLFRQTKHLSEPIALLKALLDTRYLFDEAVWKPSVDSILGEILTEFVDRRSDTLREYVLPDGGFVNTPEGRRLHVGLTFQTASSLFDLYTESLQQKGNSAVVNRKIVNQAVSWCLQTCEQAWDDTPTSESKVGLNQYVDMKSQPFIFLEWQQKWAWIHVEACAALLKCYVYTRHPDCLKWFKRIHDYTLQHFPDSKQLGWHLAIDSYGQPIVSAKAIPSVGCFSLVRCLAEISQLLPKCEEFQLARPSRFGKTRPNAPQVETRNNS
ncbi:AGE family epimerase/isomerase [Spirosoma sp. BT702]|uniref:AGE family epimerase/isomerase n=1 Tax=Spirosoma profusum TaxID=2771354 RepID=A0A927ASB8_9BACT|nr:AGE family epimerase/isomerase [Spirosoma profusum]